MPVSRAAIRIAGAIPNPNFSLLYGWGYQFTIILAGQPQQFGCQFDIQTAGKRSKKLDVARANYRASQYQIAQLIFDIHMDVVAVSQAPSPESNPDSPSPVVAFLGCGSRFSGSLSGIEP